MKKRIQLSSRSSRSIWIDYWAEGLSCFPLLNYRYFTTCLPFTFFNVLVMLHTIHPRDRCLITEKKDFRFANVCWFPRSFESVQMYHGLDQEVQIFHGLNREEKSGELYQRGKRLKVCREFRLKNMTYNSSRWLKILCATFSLSDVLCFWR